MKKIELRRGILILLLLTLVSGCASMSKEECTVVNWYALGYSSGIKGQGMERFESTQQACADYQIKADFAGFNDGYQAGLAKFCIADRGYKLASTGKAYLNVCPSSEYPAFYEAFQKGLTAFCSQDNGKKRAANGQNIDKQCEVTRFPKYHEGYSSGLVTYCTFDKGFVSGSTGKPFFENCQDPIFEGYQDGYQKGQTRYVLETEVKQLQKDLRSITRQMKKVNEDIKR
jgi:hypothetical protein